MSQPAEKLNDPPGPNLDEVAYAIGQVIDLPGDKQGTVTRLPTPDSPYVHALVTGLPFAREVTDVFRKGTPGLKPMVFGKSLCPGYYDNLGTQIMESLDLEPPATL